MVSFRYSSIQHESKRTTTRACPCFSESLLLVCPTQQPSSWVGQSLPAAPRTQYSQFQIQKNRQFPFSQYFQPTPLSVSGWPSLSRRAHGFRLYSDTVLRASESSPMERRGVSTPRTWHWETLGAIGKGGHKIKLTWEVTGTHERLPPWL